MTLRKLRTGVTTLGRNAKGFEEQFMEFLKTYQVIGLAVAFVIGTAASALVTALVKDIIMPIVGAVTSRRELAGSQPSGRTDQFYGGRLRQRRD